MKFLNTSRLRKLFGEKDSQCKSLNSLTKLSRKVPKKTNVQNVHSHFLNF